MTDSKQDCEDRYMSWLADKVSPAQLSELYVTYKNIESECTKAHVIRESLFECMNIVEIDKIRSTVEGNKLFCIFHKKESGKISSAIRYMLQYVQEAEDASKCELHIASQTLTDIPTPKASSASEDASETVDVQPQSTPSNDSERIETSESSLEERVREALRKESANNQYGETPYYLAKIAGLSVVEVRKMLNSAPWAKKVYNNYVFSEPTVAEATDFPVVYPTRVEETFENNAPNASTLPNGTFSVDFLSDEDMVFTKPFMVSYFEDRFPVRSWKDALVQTCRLLIDDYPDAFATLREKGMNPGPHPVWIVKESHAGKQHAPKEITADYYIETNRSASDIIKIIRKLLDICQVDYENLVICYRRLVESSSDATAETAGMETTEGTQPESAAHELTPEMAQLLDGDGFELLRSKLVEECILTVDQFLSARPWVFLNEYNLYPLTRRKAVYSVIKKRIQAISEQGADSVASADDSRDLPSLEDDWIISQLKSRGLTYRDKRNWDGCLWIVGGHELDGFIQSCIECGYTMSFKADGCKSFPDKSVWWTKSRPVPQVQTILPLENAESDQTSLSAFRAFLINNQHLAERTAGNYCTSIRMIEDYIQRNHLGMSILGATAANVQMIADALMARPDFIKINDDRHHQYSAALAQYIAFLTGGEPKQNKVSAIQIPAPQPLEDEAALCPKAEELVLKADLEGMTLEALSLALNISVAKTNRIVTQCKHIIEFTDRLVHEEAFVDWEEAADKLEEIIEKLLTRNNGYVSAARLYEYVRSEMQMFINDNDIDDVRTVYEIAEHLFGKVGYHGKKYAFQTKSHISRKTAAVSTIMDVMRKYASEQGGVFVEDDLVDYLQKVGIKTGNLRGQMQIYDKPIFLFYDVHTYMTAESMGINEAWLREVSRVLDALFTEVDDHIVFRQLPTLWLSQLPTLPQNRPWTPLLVQSVLMHYSRQLNGAHTIASVSGQAGDTLQAMLVSGDSGIQTFADAVAVKMADDGRFKLQLTAEELRQMLVQWEMISPYELTSTLPKALANDPRFAWSADERNVIVKVG